MRYLIIIMLAITFVSCSKKKISETDQKKLELYRELAFCKCMEQSVRQFNVLDTSEVYAGPAYTEIDAADVINQKLYKTVDSLIQQQ